MYRKKIINTVVTIAIVLGLGMVIAPSFVAALGKRYLRIA